tara:strand:- start:848 stop:1063 length:216 start_codon:yes stop_codon:yes gene_type:complete
MSKYGFKLTKGWQLDCWNRNECTIEKTTCSNYAVVDHSINSTVYLGRTYQNCKQFLGRDCDVYLEHRGLTS